MGPMDSGATGVIVGLMAFFGVITTAISARSGAKINSVDKRIDSAFGASEKLIEQYQGEVDRQHEREVSHLRRMEHLEQAVEELRLVVFAQQEKLTRMWAHDEAMRIWATEMTSWATRAEGIIARLGGTIEAPPKLPISFYEENQ